MCLEALLHAVPLAKRQSSVPRNKSWAKAAPTPGAQTSLELSNVPQCSSARLAVTVPHSSMGHSSRAHSTRRRPQLSGRVSLAIIDSVVEYHVLLTKFNISRLLSKD